MKKVLKGIALLIGILLFVALCYAISGLVIMLIWNLLAGFFGFKTIPFWVGLVISIALSIIGSAFKNSSKS